jgi:uncharacterized protein
MITVQDDVRKGRGVFAQTTIPQGALIGYLEGYPSPKRTQYSLQMGAIHVEPTNAMRYLNHACNPNARFDGYRLIALREIQAGEEIHIDYLHTETDIAAPFECRCGSPDCQGWIG